MSGLCGMPAAVQGVREVLAYVAANHPAEGMQNAVALHNLGTVAITLPGAVRALQKDLGSSVQHIFTWAKNCPTKDVRTLAAPGPCCAGCLQCLAHDLPLCATFWPALEPYARC